jgi:hypothetical protein
MWRASALSALAVAALSLLFQRALAFDPEAWVVWGRETWALAIDTSAGPSWKPLPVLVTAPLAAAGDAAPWLWLVVARAGALLALAGLWRLGGRLAAALAALSPWWLFNGALGNAEPLLVALVAWAVVAHERDRRDVAFALGCAAALLRVEVWPFLALYAGLARPAPWRVLVAAGAGVLALWVVPDLLSSDLRSLTGATKGASEGSAGTEAFPFGAVWADTLDAVGPAVLLAALLTPRRTWAAAGFAWVALVAVMAQAGFAGNPRYLIPGLAALALAAATAARGRAWAVGALLAGTLAWTAGDLSDRVADLGRRDRIRASLEAAGERDCLVRTGPDQRSAVARAFGESIPEAAAHPRAGDAVARLTAETWRISSCGR